LVTVVIGNPCTNVDLYALFLLELRAGTVETVIRRALPNALFPHRRVWGWANSASDPTRILRDAPRVPLMVLYWVNVRYTAVAIRPWVSRSVGD